MVSLSIIVPTCGRPTLARTLESIAAAGVTAADEILVIGDGRQPAAHGIAMRWMHMLSLFYLETKPTRCSGNAQRNEGLKLATGTHVLAIDDDDAYRPEALDLVRAAALSTPDRFLIFRMQSHTHRHPWGTLWKCQYPSMGNVGTPMMVAPNIPGKLGRYGNRYEGDFDFLESTLAHYPEGARWIEDVIVDVY